MRTGRCLWRAAWGSAVIAALSGLGCDDGTPPASNRPPEAVGEIQEQVLAAGRATRVALTSYFTDPDGDALTYSAAVSDSRIAGVAVSGAFLRINGTATGTCTITVTATDPGGLSATQTFDLTVRPEPSPDRHRLVVFHEAMGGEDWTNSSGWLSQAPIGEWFGVETDEEGRVTALDLPYNGLTGHIPAEIADLTHLESLSLPANAIEGLPIQLFRHPRLARLNLALTYLGGPLPREIAGLSSLTELIMRGSGLQGPIPAELGELANLEWLDLSVNWLNDSIPPELGKLTRLTVLIMEEAGIRGGIPGELGNLSSLEHLILEGNDMSGPMPPELGNLSRLVGLNLARNGTGGESLGISGPIPGELGELGELVALTLHGNSLTGSVPGELGRLAKLRVLSLTRNPLEGPLPAALTGLRSLKTFAAGATELCAPADTLFTRWLEGIPNRRVRTCGGVGERAYLVQAVQSRDYPVPLIAGQPALLRVFPTADADTEETLPPARATFHPGSGAGGPHVVDIPAGAAAIPQQVREGRLDLSLNAEIPGSVVRPGLELVVDLDPDGMLDSTLGVIKRVPEEGRLAVEVLEMPTFDVTVVPFLWAADPDSAILDLTDGMTAEDTLFGDTRILLPVADMTVTVHDPVVAETNDAWDLYQATDMIRTSEQGTGHYLGTMSGEVVGSRGIASVGGRIAFSIPDSRIMAHEFGHNFRLLHAPCGGASRIDPGYPYVDGSIGAWGFDPRADTLVGGNTPDLMSYCSPAWISDYHYTNAARFRVHDDANAMSTTTQQRVLFLWGGADARGAPHLDPAFVLDAPPSLPRADGPHRITGRDADGAELFALRFEMPVIADGDGSSSFVFALPVREGWADALASITLSGPGGSFTLDRSTDRPMAILRDPESGRIRRIMRDLPPGPAGREAAERAAAEGGWEVIFSRGIPDPGDWGR